MTISLTRAMVFAICLLGFTATASARDRDHYGNGAWKLGHGHDHYGIYRFDGRSWRRMPGTATAVGDGWVIGTDRRGGGFGIYRWTGRGWNRVPGGAVSIGGTYAQPWVINNRGEQFYWNGYDWDPARRGGPRYINEPRGNAFGWDRNKHDSGRGNAFGNERHEDNARRGDDFGDERYGNNSRRRERDR